MRNLFADIRFGFRMLKKDMGTSVLAILSMALGIAAVTSIFSVVYAVLFDPFPYKDFNRIVSLGISSLKTGQGRGMHTVPEFIAIREHSRALEDAFAMGFESLRLDGAGGAEFVGGKLFSSNAFEFLGVKPLLGRTFLPDDYGSGGAPRPVIILSHLLWQQRFASDPGVLGREVRLNGINHTVIGVMPRRFTLYASPGQPAIWLPLPNDPTQQRPVLVHGRLRPGVSLQSASVDLRSILTPFAEASPKSFPAEGFSVRLRLFSDWVRPWIRTTVYVLLAAVGFLLLIACCNVANLLLARGGARTKEICVRLSVGARRWDLVKQLLTESVLLSVSGGFLGVLLAFLGTRALVTLLPPNAINSEMEFRINAVVLASSFAVSVLTGILFGLIPALHSSRVDLSQTLKDAGRGSSGGVGGQWTRNALTVSAIAFSMILLVGAGLMIRTFAALTQDSDGIQADQVLTMWLPASNEEASNVAHRNALYQNVLEQLESAPGVKSAAFSNGWPPTTFLTTQVEMQGATRAQRPEAAFHAVSARYFETLGIPLLQGNLFTERDVLRGEHVAVINQTMLRSVFPPGESPIGQNVRLALLTRPQVSRVAGDPSVRIVGVVGDSRNAGPRKETIPEIFVPFTLTPWTNYGLAVRTGSDPFTALRTVRSRIAAFNKDQPLADVRTLEERIASATAQERFITVLLCVFAAVGLALAAIGIYGVMSYTVTQRTREMGIRAALGAGSGDVVRLVVARGFRLAFIGVVVGALGSAALTHLISSQLYGVTATNPAVFAGVSAFVTLVGLAACYLPARRAASISPLVALRTE